MGILVLFLIVEEKLSVFQHWVSCSLRVLYICLLLCWGNFLPLLGGCFCHERVLNSVKCFYSIKMIMKLHSADVAYYIARFLYIRQSLHSRNKFPLVMVYNPFNVLYSIAYILLRILAWMFVSHWFVVFLVSLSGFGISNTGLTEWIRKHSLLFSFLEKFEKGWY